MQNADEWEYGETERKSEDETEPPLKYEIMNYPADITLQGYLDMWDRAELEIPDFQRAFVWDQVRASRLIESFLLGLPVPGVFLFKRRDEPTYSIVDGQQRIKSITAFLKGEFKERIFRLKNILPQWNGKRFEELSEKDQFRLKGSVLRSTIIQQINPDDQTSVYQIFERLNTGGVNLNPMEIRQCVSSGPFIDHLKQLNENNHWRQIIGKPNPDNRLRDIELILRCLALNKKADTYEKPMKGFLNEYAEDERREPSNYEKETEQFASVCSSIIEQLGEKPFHLRDRLNYGLLDSILSVLLSTGPVDDLRTKKDGLLGEQGFQDAITKNTSDVVEVSKRLELAKKVMSH